MLWCVLQHFQHKLINVEGFSEKKKKIDKKIAMRISLKGVEDVGDEEGAQGTEELKKIKI